MNRHYEYNIPITEYNKSTMIEMLNRKFITSRYSNRLVSFYEQINLDALNDNAVISTGSYFIDMVEGEISDWKDLILHLKDGTTVSMEDYSYSGDYTNPDVFPSLIDESVLDRDEVMSMVDFRNVHYIHPTKIKKLKEIIMQLPEDYSYEFDSGKTNYGIIINDKRKRVDFLKWSDIDSEIEELVDAEVFDYFEKQKMIDLLTSWANKEDPKGIGDYIIKQEAIDRYYKTLKEETDFWSQALDNTNE